MTIIRLYAGAILRAQYRADVENSANEVLKALQAYNAEFNVEGYFVELEGQLAQFFSAQDFAGFRSAVAPLLDTRQNLNPEYHNLPSSVYPVQDILGDRYPASQNTFDCDYPKVLTVCLNTLKLILLLLY